MKFKRCIVILALVFSVAVSAIAQASAKPAEDLERAATAAREQGDTQASVKLYERALARNAGWHEGWWYYGSLLYDQNQYPEAIGAFRKLVELDGHLTEAWAMLGLSEYETHDYDDALKDLQRAEREGAVADASLQNVVDFHFALLLNAHGDSDGALLLLSSLYLKGVRSESLQVALGLSLLRVPILPSDLAPSRDALVHDAGSLEALVATKQNDKADLAFRDLLTRYPKVQFLHYGYGGLLASMGRDDDAKAQLQAETELNPESVLAYVEWSFIAMRDKRYAESEKLARRATELNGDSFLAHYVLGNSLLMTGDSKDAVPELETAKRLSPQEPDIRYSLSRAYARLGKPELAKQEQAEFLTLQRKNAMDRLALLKRYPGSQPLTGIRPTTPQ